MKKIGFLKKTNNPVADYDGFWQKYGYMIGTVNDDGKISVSDGFKIGELNRGLSNHYNGKFDDKVIKGKVDQNGNIQIFVNEQE